MEDMAQDALAVHDVVIPPLGLAGTLRIPHDPTCMVIFAHGSGSSRFSPRNKAVAEGLGACGIATLLFDLLTPGEEAERQNVFDVRLLADRLADAIAWTGRQPALAPLPLGLFGASTGAAAALIAAARHSGRVGAVVSRGGRPDLAGDALAAVLAPVLLIVGGSDHAVMDLNRDAFRRLPGPKALETVSGASHLFPEPGALEAVILLAADWFLTHLTGTSGAHRRAATQPRGGDARMLW